MNAPIRNFEAKTATSENRPLLVGIMSPSGGGKTYSALRLATGMQQVFGGEICMLDTENKRALHYADMFKFTHVPFDPPFSSVDYLRAVEFCAKRKPGVIIVDSMSHEHVGEGGFLETAEEVLNRIAGDDYKKREAAKFAGWAKAGPLRTKMIEGLKQLNGNFIFCWRAKEKVKPMKVNGKFEAVNLGLMPIAGEEWVYEMTVNCMLPARAGGVPLWRADHVGEKMMMKLPKQFETIFAKEQPLSEDIGRALAVWARGGASPVVASGIPPVPADPPAPPDTQQDGAGEVSMTDLDDALAKAAANGKAALETRWKKLSADEQKILRPALERRHWPTALQADAAQTKGEGRSDG